MSLNPSVLQTCRQRLLEIIRSHVCKQYCSFRTSTKRRIQFQPKPDLSGSARPLGHYASAKRVTSGTSWHRCRPKCTAANTTGTHRFLRRWPWLLRSCEWRRRRCFTSISSFTLAYDPFFDDEEGVVEDAVPSVLWSKHICADQISPQPSGN
jgi:hypothetical protein